MASEIRVDTSKNASGLCTVTYSNTGAVFSGISTFAGDVYIPDKIIHSGDTNTAIRFPATDQISFETAGSERLRIAAGGNFGIGDLSNVSNVPQTGLHYANSSGIFRIHNTTNDFYSHIAVDSGGSLSLESDAGNGSGSSTIIFKVDTSEKVRITSGGKTLIHGGGATGANDTATILENGNTLNIHGTSSSDGISVVRYSANYGAYGINIGKSRNNTFGTNTLVQDGNELGHISFYGADGTDFEMAAQITAKVDGDPATGGDGTDMPGALSFRTTPEGSDSPTEKLRIFSDGDVGIGTDTMVNDSKVHLWDGSTSNYRPIVIDSAATNGSTLVYRQLGTQVISIGSGGGNNLSGSSVTHGLIRSEVATVFAVGNSEKLRITSTGQLQATGAADVRLTLGSSGTAGTNNSVHIRADSADLKFMAASGGNTIFERNGTESLRIASDGLVKWGGHTLSARNSATGVAGGMIYNSEGKVFQYHDGSGWITLNTTNQIVATGGNTVSTSNGYRIHDFVGSSTFEITSGFGEVEVLVVAGGGSEGGGNAGCHGGGGGGGGGVVYQKINLYAGKYPVTIGSGGLWRNNGENSVFGAGTDNTITAYGGGAGGPTLDGNGNSGGSGGGGSRHDTSNQGGSSTQPIGPDGGFGNAGGNTGSNTSPGGGGGAAGIGTDGSSGGIGGAGKQFTQFGNTVYFGAGGNGNSTGGSAGQTQGSNNGAANTGAGGGGSAGTGTRYYGGSGRVMIRYPAAS